MDEAAALAKSRCGAMIAAAGCGKTQIISRAVAEYGCGRELVLTHTHAGVEALRSRFARLGVDRKSYYVDTIAGWALRLATAFPRTSALPTAIPRTSREYSAVYSAATQLVRLRPVREILRASYSGVYVDEYQDCTVEQHSLVLTVRDVLPCRVVGDPLQGIFGFGDNQLIQWDEHVDPSFERVPGPATPWRWAKSNPALGEWLQEVRVKLFDNQGIDLRNAPVLWVDGSNPSSKASRQQSACLNAVKNVGETVIAIHKWPSQGHDVARRLKGVYSCVEAIDSEDLYAFANRVDKSQGIARAVAVLDFAGKCMIRVRSELKSIREALEKGRVPRVQKHRDHLEALLSVAHDNSWAIIEPVLRKLSELSGVSPYRRELLEESKRALGVVVAGDAETLAEAVWTVRNRTRRRGRILARCAVGRTLLVKGLEFDHAILLDADVFDASNLYVALTRGSKSLRVVSKSRVIQPVKGDGPNHTRPQFSPESPISENMGRSAPHD